MLQDSKGFDKSCVADFIIALCSKNADFKKDWNVRIFFVKRIYLQLCLCITVSSRWQEGWKSCLSNFYSRENLSSNSVSLLKRKLIYLGKVFLMFTQPLLHLFIVLYKLSYGIVCEDPYYTQYVSSYLFCSVVKGPTFMEAKLLSFK